VAEVKTIAVIGAGIMGRGIAHAAAVGGYRTILEDILPNALRRAETEIRANLLFILFRDKETIKYLPVSIRSHLTDHLSHNNGSLFVQQLVIRVRGVINRSRGICVSALPPRKPPKVADRQILGQTANEPGELLRFAHLSTPDLFQRFPERLLAKIFDISRIFDPMADNDRHTTAVSLYQLLFR